MTDKEMTNDLRERVILIHRRTRTFQTNEAGKKKLGNNIKKILEKKKVTQSELARRMGVTRSAVYYWTSGKANVLNSNLAGIATCLCVSVKDLLEGIEVEEML